MAVCRSCGTELTPASRFCASLVRRAGVGDVRRAQGGDAALRRHRGLDRDRLRPRPRGLQRGDPAAARTDPRKRSSATAARSRSTSATRPGGGSARLSTHEDDRRAPVRAGPSRDRGRARRERAGRDQHRRGRGRGGALAPTLGEEIVLRRRRQHGVRGSRRRLRPRRSYVGEGESPRDCATPFEYGERSPAFEAKGKSEPVPAWRSLKVPSPLPASTSERGAAGAVRRPRRERLAARPEHAGPRAAPGDPRPSW